MQIRRVLLLFALVLGLSALVASIAPSPDERDEPSDEAPATETTPTGGRTAGTETLSLSVRPAPSGQPPVRRVPAGSSFTLEVAVPEPGDVVLDGLGLRQSADQLTPARFDLLAEPPGRYDVTFVPVDGERRLAGRIEFGQPATVTPQQPGR